MPRVFVRIAGCAAVSAPVGGFYSFRFAYRYSACTRVDADAMMVVRYATSSTGAGTQTEGAMGRANNAEASALVASLAVRIDAEVRREIEAKRLHPRETFNDVLRRLLGLNQ